MSTFDLFRRALTLAALALTLGACVYRIDIQQGNLLEAGDVDLLTVGMERGQVQFLLGTPMIHDPFHRDRWDYPYYYVRGRSENVVRRWRELNRRARRRRIGIPGRGDDGRHGRAPMPHRGR